MKAITVFLVLCIIPACSFSQSSIVPDPNEEASVKTPAVSLPQSNRWAWDIGLYRVSEDHLTLEKLIIRSPDLHYNINMFVEPPSCSYCLTLGKPKIDPDGSIEIKVTLRHPFLAQPKYTGFDVRGTIMFPATRYWKTKGYMYTVYQYPVFEGKIPLYFSRSEDGGAQLLNADGYTFYLFPGLDLGPEFDQPVFNYSKGVHAYGPDPDSTVNGFKLFTNDPQRRMFKVSDVISRIYHIAPPEGEFVFGYVVDASWAPPTKTPVTDPLNDFPFYANCEDGYVLESKQLTPFKTGGFYGGYEVAETKFLAYSNDDATMWAINSRVVCPDLAPPENPDNLGFYKGVVATNDGMLWKIESPGIFSTKLSSVKTTYDAPPGNYLGLVFTFFCNYYPGSDYPVLYFNAPLLDFITLDVVQGD